MDFPQFSHPEIYLYYKPWSCMKSRIKLKLQSTSLILCHIPPQPSVFCPCRHSLGMIPHSMILGLSAEFDSSSLLIYIMILKLTFTGKFIGRARCCAFKAKFHCGVLILQILNFSHINCNHFIRGLKAGSPQEK